MQNAALEATRLDAVYLAFRVASPSLLMALEGFKAIGLSGFNVTIPHKVAVMRHLDDLEEPAATIGAVNTVVNHNGRLVGHNTDGAGALAALRESGVEPSGKRVLLLGSGGAARALAFTMAETAENLTILNRTISKARTLAEDIRRITGTTSVTGGGANPSTLKNAAAQSNMVVNATSIGMNPNARETPIAKELLRPDMVVFDIVYSPLETRLLRDAGQVGAKCVNGLTMLVCQGAQAFKLWTRAEAPVSAMKEALTTVLKAKSDRGLD
jgi:shikimate dehydrogenase